MLGIHLCLAGKSGRGGRWEISLQQDQGQQHVGVGQRRHSLIVGMVTHSLQELVWGLGGERSFRAGLFQSPPGNHSALLL